MLAWLACKHYFDYAFFPDVCYAYWHGVDPTATYERKGLIYMGKDEDSIDRSAIASQGGLARAKRTPPKRRSEIAKAARRLSRHASYPLDAPPGAPEMKPRDRQLLHAYVTRPIFLKLSWWDRIKAMLGVR